MHDEFASICLVNVKLNNLINFQCKFNFFALIDEYQHTLQYNAFKYLKNCILNVGRYKRVITVSKFKAQLPSQSLM